MRNNILGNSLGISQGLIATLDRLFPDTLPTSNIGLEELRYLQGQRSVIKKLAELSEDDFNQEE
jgi:hypothetical protein|tara:strand:+ start:217 stop:408 length:192 start_codon:yes stop_codon:yes gene_type:complete